MKKHKNFGKRHYKLKQLISPFYSLLLFLYLYSLRLCPELLVKLIIIKICQLVITKRHFFAFLKARLSR